MTVTVATLYMSAVLGIIGSDITRAIFGIKRSEIGVHKQDGKLVKAHIGTIYLSIVALVSVFVTQKIHQEVNHVIVQDPLLAIAGSSLCMYLYISATSYDRSS